MTEAEEEEVVEEEEKGWMLKMSADPDTPIASPSGSCVVVE